MESLLDLVFSYLVPMVGYGFSGYLIGKNLGYQKGRDEGWEACKRHYLGPMNPKQGKIIHVKYEDTHDGK